MQTQTITVRQAVAADGPVFLDLVAALAAYEHLDPPDEAARGRLLQDAFGAKPRFTVLLAERDGQAVGYAVILEMYSTFLARPTLFLEDIFVLDSARRGGAGLALFKACAAEAVRRDCGRMEWFMLDWNETARKFYQRLGAKVNAEWVPFRMTRKEFEAIR